MSSWWSFGGGSTTKKEPAVATQAVPSQQSFKAMSNAFRKGVQYNMKIVLRGDVMTGKSNLFHRLQGSEFNEEYTSTPQIQVANIPWHYKDSNDIVKIEVWDVVDKAHNKNKSESSKGIKLEHRPSDTKGDTAATSNPQSPQQQQQEDQDVSMGLDASTVNVYRNTHGAILMFDTTKPWTFDYVNQELKNVPESMAVLVLGNFCDKTQERKVEMDTIHATLYEHNQERIKNGAIKPNLIRYAETSMQSGLGLKYIYEYLGVPFLQLMIESLNKQLELKAVEIVDLLETLDTDADVPTGMQRRRGQDNFDQPSEPRLARQQEEMKSAWDQELEDIASDHPSMLDQFPRRQETPPVPTAPVKSKKKMDVKLVPEQVPAVVDFSVGDELNDDWFGEDVSNANINLPQPDRQDSDDEGPGNPMVLGDEDVEPIFYNKPSITHEQRIVVQAEHEPEHPQEQVHSRQGEEEKQEYEEEYQPVFKSELNDVWSCSLRRLSGPEVISDSEDEDNRMRQTDSPFAPESPFMESPTFQSGFAGGYEEIGGSNENPWSIGQSKLTLDEKPRIQHEWHHETTEHEGEQGETIEPDTTIVDQPTVEKSKKKESSGKKKKSSTSSSSKKKSSSSKKKKPQ
ncbi:Nitrogen permease regulator 2 [Mucor velutinosus]|uniref:Nitrogen permease regulator 2 n=1 Tax=Mucor velutinosus TaxID=708070 RepID=A0AAN7I482_9FUNG|nr:Nitrogen permease regulator 2 [Mucor velutinosus]